MPSPSPNAVVKLIAKTDTSVIEPSTNSSANVPRIARPPMVSGNNAATTEPNASTSSSIVTGTAIASAIARLLVTCDVTSTFAPASPPAVTVTGPSLPAYRGMSALARSSTWSSDPSMWARTTAWRPSVERSAGAWVDQYETTSDTLGSAASRVVTARPALATELASTLPVCAVTSSARFDSPPKRESINCCARVDWAAGSLNPPLFSLPNAPTPSSSMATIATPEIANRTHARRATNLPYRSSMIFPPDRCLRCQHDTIC